MTRRDCLLPILPESRSAGRLTAHYRRCRRYRAQPRGLSTTIHATVDALGNPTGLFLSAGQACELDGADVLLPQVAAMTVTADKGYDAEARVLAPLRTASKTAIIPPRRTRTNQRAYDRDLSHVRHLIEHFFCTRKQFRAIATRYDKTARSFLAAIHLAASAILLN